MNATGPVARLEDVTRRYFGLRHVTSFALSATSLEILPGTWTVITGRSGSGKTTLLQLLSGLDRPDGGRVWLFGRDLSQLSDGALSDLRRERLGFVYQQYQFIEHLPVWQNVSSRLVPAGMPARLRRRRAEELLAALQLAGAADRLPRQLSGGEQQRVALARALAGNPLLLFADEPTSNVDAETSELIIEYLGRLRSRGATVVVATHDPALIERADVHYVMEKGSVRLA